MPDLYQLLSDLNIPYIKHDHPPVFTCEEADRLCGNIPGGKSKNLFLRNKKGDKHFLIIVESLKRVDLKVLSKMLNESGLSFASPERLMKYLKLTPGSVSPFGLIYDEEKHVKVFVDRDLLKCDRLQYHPNINTATLEISREDFLKFLESTGNSVQVIEL